MTEGKRWIRQRAMRCLGDIDACITLACEDCRAVDTITDDEGYSAHFAAGLSRIYGATRDLRKQFTQREGSPAPQDPVPSENVEVSKAEVEAGARIVYEMLQSLEPEPTPAWVEGGNSDKQFDARRCARRVLEAAVRSKITAAAG